MIESNVKMSSHQIFHKTAMCKFFAMGRCMRSSKCTFAHHVDELRQAPDFSCTKMCPDLVSEGRCTRGWECTFAHDARELRTTHGPAMTQSRPMVSAPSSSTATFPALLFSSPGAAWQLPGVAAPWAEVDGSTATAQLPVDRFYEALSGCQAPTPPPPPEPAKQQEASDTSPSVEDEDLELPAKCWTRWSTEEVGTELTRYSTVSSEEQCKEQGDTLVTPSSSSAQRAPTEHSTCLDLAQAWGLPVAVRHTFLEFRLPQPDPPGSFLRRARSTQGRL
uniref:C3H1-type domain-containing protein n=1 Tax=Alexandrium andersonii TaxID=327968 RepID=A0A6U6U697_9DINO|mmetsp:Transcript_76719/g.171670  ORF Transcript_76719/g.171670 Transcript_76719/m.171670 type:complete len:277 (+) Transcript_76719:75-905(+)